MSLPPMNRISVSQQITNQFGGYDVRESTGVDGAVAMTNMSSDKYPYAASRDLRYKTYTPSTNVIRALGAYDKLYYVLGSVFFYDTSLISTLTATAKQFVSIGNKIVIFPDKKTYLVEGSGTFDTLYETWSGTVEFTDGTLYGVSAVANTIHYLTRASTDYLTTLLFNVGDAITISGCTDYPDNNKTVVIREKSVDSKYLRFDENIFDKGTESATIIIARTIPDMDFVCECNNRLWGCKTDTIYASALGDPSNFNKFEGLSTDSYSVEVGSAGDFTGCFAYMGYPIFFKEDSIYKVYGTQPSNFEAMRSANLGCASGSYKSFAVAGEVLYYLSRVGIMAYTGSVPENISAPFGETRYKNAVGGTDGVKYYVSMQDSVDAWHLFTYDTRYKVWHREDATHVVDFAWYSGNLYMGLSTGFWVIGNPVAPTGSTVETSLPWSYETGDIFENDVNKKDVKKILLRCTLETGATLKLEIKYDSTGSYTTVKDLTAAIKQSYYMPIIPRRCDHYRLKFSGVGAVTLHSLTRETVHGSANKL